MDVTPGIMCQIAGPLRLMIERESGAAVRFGAPADYGTDGGQLQELRPQIVVQAVRDDDVRAAVRAGHRAGVPVAVRGAGHSCGGQSLTDGILVVNVPQRGEAATVSDESEATVSARSRWDAVESTLHRAGRAIPVLADYLNLSVGGTLSVGGYGVDSIVHGALVDQVIRLRILEADGTPRWCSPSDDGERFGRVLAGLGRSGAIEEAVMRTVPYQRYTTMFSYRHRNLRELVASTAWLAAEGAALPSMFKAFHAAGRYVSVYGEPAATLRDALRAVPPDAMRSAGPARRMVYPSYRRVRSAAVALWARRFRQHRKIWCDYFFDAAGLAAFESFLAPLRAADAFAGCLQNIYLLAVRRLPRRAAMPLEASGSIVGPVAFGIGLYCMVAPRRIDRVAAVERAMSRCLEMCVRLGGRPYLYGSHRLSAAMSETLYGQAGL